MVKINAKKQRRINEAMQLLDNSYRKDVNSIRINVGNTISHEVAKLKVVYRLIKEGKLCYTEAVFKNGARADIYVPEDFRVFEILHSETEAEALSKKDYYPFELDIVLIKSCEVD